jgi:hypothetical protein
MEKHERFSELRKGILPKVLQTRYPGLARLIQQMTDIDVNKRPTIQTVMKIVEGEILRLESNTLGLGASEILIQRNRFYSYDIKDRKDFHLKSREFRQLTCNEDSFTLKIVIDEMEEYSNLGNREECVTCSKPKY